MEGNEIPVRVRCSGLCAVHCDGRRHVPDPLPPHLAWQRSRRLGAYGPDEQDDPPAGWTSVTVQVPVYAGRPEGAWPDLGAGWDVAEILAAIRVVDQHLDDAGPPWAKDCPEANMYRRMGKAQLEAAEAMEELSLLTGENPRKGQHLEAREKMLAELGDTAVAALLGIQSQLKDTDAAWEVFIAALSKALARVPGARPA